MANDGHITHQMNLNHRLTSQLYTENGRTVITIKIIISYYNKKFNSISSDN